MYPRQFIRFESMLSGPPAHRHSKARVCQDLADISQIELTADEFRQIAMAAFDHQLTYGAGGPCRVDEYRIAIGKLGVLREKAAISISVQLLQKIMADPKLIGGQALRCML